MPLLSACSQSQDIVFLAGLQGVVLPNADHAMPYSVSYFARKSFFLSLAITSR